MRRRRTVAGGPLLGRRVGTLHVPAAGAKTISSLRLPQLGRGKFSAIEVSTDVLDRVCRRENIERIDLVKLDVEGAESDVLAGATRVLHEMRPVWIFEALDITSGAWATRALELIGQFSSAGYDLFEFLPSGELKPHSVREDYPLQSNCNLVAVARERFESIRPMLAMN